MSQIPPANAQPQAAAGGQTSGKAIASLVLSLVGLFACALLGIAGIILGQNALTEIRSSGGTIQGEGLAKAGIIIGWIELGLMVVFCIIYAVIGVGVAGSAATNPGP